MLYSRMAKHMYVLSSSRGGGGDGGGGVSGGLARV